MTGQSLLDRMELFNPELQLQPGEEDVTRGLTALNIAQDYYESLAAQRGKIHGGQVGTVATVNNTETTAFPTGVLRIDRLQTLNASTNRPDGDVGRIKRVGGHATSTRWPYNVTLSTAPGKPASYWTNGTSIYWSPVPDAAYNVRWYGFQVAADITALGTFAYPDIVSIPLATFAARIMKIGLEDPVQDLAAIANETFKSTLDALENFNRDGASGLEYTEPHTE